MKIYYRNSELVASTSRELRVENFQSSDIVQNVLVLVRPRNARSVDNVAAANASIEEDSNQCLAIRSQMLGISVTSLLQILKNDLGLHYCKIKLTQNFKRFDHQKRCMFANFNMVSHFSGRC